MAHPVQSELIEADAGHRPTVALLGRLARPSADPAWRGMGRRHLCLRTLAGALLLAQAVCSTGSAAILDDMQPLELHPGAYLSQSLPDISVPGIRVQIALGKAPAGARIVVDDSGHLRIDWQSGIDLPPETLIEILLTNLDDGSLLESRYLLVRRAGQSREASAQDLAEPQQAAASPLREDPDLRMKENSGHSPLDVPAFDRMYNQIVSAGRVISLRVDADIPDGTRPDIIIDRLPRYASFEQNPDGSHTFFWQTSDKVQGEHLFRFTASNPKIPDIRVSRNLVIVVGDPSLGHTEPDRTSADIIE